MLIFSPLSSLQAESKLIVHVKRTTRRGSFSWIFFLKHRNVLEQISTANIFNSLVQRMWFEKVLQQRSIQRSHNSFRDAVLTCSGLGLSGYLRHIHHIVRLKCTPAPISAGHQLIDKNDMKALERLDRGRKYIFKNMDEQKK